MLVHVRGTRVVGVEERASNSLVGAVLHEALENLIAGDGRPRAFLWI